MIRIHMYCLDDEYLISCQWWCAISRSERRAMNICDGRSDLRNKLSFNIKSAKICFNKILDYYNAMGFDITGLVKYSTSMF